MPDQDSSAQLRCHVMEAVYSGLPLCIRGEGRKDFYGRAPLLRHGGTLGGVLAAGLAGPRTPPALGRDAPAEQIRALATAAGGHATRLHHGDRDGPVLQPLPAPLEVLHRRLKAVSIPLAS